MKLNCGLSTRDKWNLKLAHRGEWHRWFAWHPVRVDTRECRWLEVVERKSKYVIHWPLFGIEWESEYRRIENDRTND